MLDYGIDKANRLTSETRTGVPGSSRRYGYTPLDQLCWDADATTTGGSCATPPTGAQPYDYDPADNLTQLPQAATQQHNAANQLCWSSTSPSANACGSPPTGATTYSYDTRGNRTATTPAAGPALTYTFDQANRLKTVTAGGTLTITNTYDGNGLRTAKAAGATTTNYAWDHSAGLPLVLIEGSNYWVYGPDGLPLERVDTNGTGNPLYHHHDRLGSTRLITDSTGTTTATATYDPYGTPTTTGTPTSLGYTGEQHDVESGLIYLRTRYYDPGTGSYVTRDVVVALTRSAYGWVGGAVQNSVDPLGTSECRPQDYQYGLCGAPPVGYQGTQQASKPSATQPTNTRFDETGSAVLSSKDDASRSPQCQALSVLAPFGYSWVPTLGTDDVIAGVVGAQVGKVAGRGIAAALFANISIGAKLSVPGSSLVSGGAMLGLAFCYGVTYDSATPVGQYNDADCYVSPQGIPNAQPIYK